MPGPLPGKGFQPFTTDFFLFTRAMSLAGHCKVPQDDSEMGISRMRKIAGEGGRRGRRGRKGLCALPTTSCAYRKDFFLRKAAWPHLG